MAVAKEKNVSPAQVALAWLLHKGVTAPIIGATKIEHIEEAVGALEISLTLKISHDLKPDTSLTQYWVTNSEIYRA